MPEDLQQLLTRINNDYLKKAEAEKNAILENAKAEAAAIIAEAKTGAEKIIEDAGAEGAALRDRYLEELKRAARDCARELRNELRNILVAAAGKAATEAMTPEFMADLIGQMVRAAPQGAAAEAAILTNPRNIESLRKRIPGTLRAEIKAGTFKGGLQVSLDKSGEYFDFSDESVRSFFRKHLEQELDRLLEGER